jgi:hypothetical protein
VYEAVVLAPDFGAAVKDACTDLGGGIAVRWRPASGRGSRRSAVGTTSCSSDTSSLSLLLALFSDGIPVHEFFSLASAGLLVGIDGWGFGGDGLSVGRPVRIGILGPVEQWLAGRRIDAVAELVQGMGDTAPDMVSVALDMGRFVKRHGRGHCSRYGDYAGLDEGDVISGRHCRGEVLVYVVFKRNE